MNKNIALRVAGIVFALVAIAHVLRLYFQAQIIVDKTPLPMEASYLGLIIAVVLSLWMFMASRNHR